MNGDKRRFPCFQKTCSACSVIPVQKRINETSRVTIRSPRARDFAPTSPQTLAERHNQSPCLQPGQHERHSCTLQRNDESFVREKHVWSRSADGGGVNSSGFGFFAGRHAIVEIVSKHGVHNAARSAWAAGGRSLFHARQAR